MADKITGYGRAGLDVGTTRARAIGRTERNADTEAAGRARTADDAVELTGTAAKLKSIEASLAQLPDVDSARVAAIRERIDAGDYRPDAARIAEKLIRLERDLV